MGKGKRSKFGDGVKRQDGGSEEGRKSLNGGSGTRTTDHGKSKPASWAWAAVIFGTQLLVYAGTLFPSIPGGDATELIFNGCQLSVPHPPGYPLFTILEWIAMNVIPVGSLAYRANFVAAIFGALASSFIFLTVTEITENIVGGVVASVLFGSGKLVWFYSIQAEVFSLNNFFASLIFFLSAKATRTRNANLVYLGSLVCGLALTNQHTIVFYVVTCIPFVYWKTFERMRNFRSTVILIAMFVVGLSPYTYLMFAPGFGKPGSWGDTSNFGGILTHLLRREYGTFRLFSGHDAAQSSLVEGMRKYFTAMLNEDNGCGIVLAAVGLLLSFCFRLFGFQPNASSRSFGDSSGTVLCVFAAFSFYTLTFHHLANLPLSSDLHLGVHARFWMQSYVALYTLGGVGVSYVLALASALTDGSLGRDRRSQRGKGNGNRKDRSANASAGASEDQNQVLLPLSILFAALLYGAKYKSMDESNNYVAYNAFYDVLQKFPLGSKVIVKGDLFTNSLRYLQQCEAIRTDVELVDQAMLTYEWFVKVQAGNFPSYVWPRTHYHPFQESGFSMLELLQANHRKDEPVFMLGGWNPQDPTTTGAYVHVPWGVADLVAPQSDPFERWDGDVWAWHRQCEGLQPSLDLPSHYTRDRWEYVVYSDSNDVASKNALQLLNHALSNENDAKALEEAERMMASHISRGHSLKSHHYRNLGIARNRLMLHPAFNTADMYDKTKEAFTTYLKIADALGEPVQEREAIEQLLSM